eukprot:5506588-Ditylum_brightwellii.AAC.1
MENPINTLQQNQFTFCPPTNNEQPLANHTKVGISKMEGIRSFKDTSKAKVIKEEVAKEVEEVAAVDVMAVDEER